jgi:hypothetical protein
MKHFVVYNNPDVFPIGIMDSDPFAAYTNNPVPDVGSRVWVLAGEGKPRTYFLRSYFFVDEIGSGSQFGFKTKVSGSSGEAFDPMIELPSDEWFVDFKLKLGNFGFGLRLVTDPRFIKGLENSVPGS